MMQTHRSILDALITPLTPLYGVCEARAIALLAATELSGRRTVDFLTDPDAPLTIDRLDDIITELAKGRPVQYVLGYTEFCDLRIGVREGVLIPRPETEELVEWIVREHPHGGRMLDIGTGSGCIAIALKHRLPQAELFATDISDEALAVAAENCRCNEAAVILRRADALHDLEAVFPERFDVVVSNPPYVPQSDLDAMHTNVREFEPHLALFVADNDPLLFYRAIVRAARGMLTPDGALYFEIYEHYAESMHRLLEAEGYTHIVVRKDLNAKPRMICCHLA